MSLSIFQTFFQNPIALLFLILAVGIAIGKVNIKGVTLGASGVLFVGMVAGHMGLTLPNAVQDLGIILFVYMVGLQAGPRFFSTFRRNGFFFAQLAAVITLTGLAATICVALIWDIPGDLAAGMFAGALTSTPGLAAATEAAGNTIPSVGYGLAYPFGIIAIILFSQIALRRRKNGAEHPEAQRTSDPRADAIMIIRKVFAIKNPSIDGRTIRDLNIHAFSSANITRVQHNDDIGPARPDTQLFLGDHLSVTGTKEEVNKFSVLLGPEVENHHIFQTRNVVRRDVFISEKDFSGKSLAELHIQEHYGVVVSRVERDGWVLTPSGDFVLEIGDAIMIVGTATDCEQLRKDAGQDVKRIQETNVLSFITGIILGSILGFTPISLPGGITFRLGLAGGPLLVALLFSHFGRIGPINIRVPYGAKYILRELGLMFFLAGAGVNAGQHLVPVLQTHGLSLLGAGIVVTLSPIVIGSLICRYVLHFDVLSMLGAMAGGMTSTPALGVVSSATGSETPTLAYTSIYPLALILTTVAAQCLALFL
jgi:putative transport protein